ncbi:hypothetical protein [Azospirillum sp. TSO22-1]|uniref:hypothetical protein n=1 Tax=Azospirillum sp. TSO22-1 TaxID=716789 RepID=UPI000D618AB9|nr:hypothetical protein [Azospirillum sp. TSO22-1]PWC56731.1 hypothetical protein TSO221_01050 [Azospirillum sp. TSO22-1]
MTVQTVDMSGTDMPAGPSKGTLGFIAFALVCLLPLSSDIFVSLVGKASGVTGPLAYVFAWSASFAMGLLALIAIGFPALVLWHLVSGRR